MTLISYKTRLPWTMVDSAFGVGQELGWRAGLDAGFGYDRYPRVNIWTSEHDVVVDAELAGVEPDKVEVSLTDDQLTLSGDREIEHAAQGEVIHRQERIDGAFSRTITLPFRGEADKVSATYRNGILRIVVPRVEDDKPRKIKIEAA